MLMRLLKQCVFIYHESDHLSTVHACWLSCCIGLRYQKIPFHVQSCFLTHGNFSCHYLNFAPVSHHSQQLTMDSRSKLTNTIPLPTCSGLHLGSLLNDVKHAKCIFLGSFLCGGGINMSTIFLSEPSKSSYSRFIADWSYLPFPRRTSKVFPCVLVIFTEVTHVQRKQAELTLLEVSSEVSGF